MGSDSIDLRKLLLITAFASFPRAGVTAIKLSDIVPSPLREKVRMRGSNKGVSLCLFSSPQPSPAGEGDFFLRKKRGQTHLFNDILMKLFFCIVPTHRCGNGIIYTPPHLQHRQMLATFSMHQITAVSYTHLTLPTKRIV